MPRDSGNDVGGVKRAGQMTGNDQVEGAEFLGGRVGLSDSFFAEIDVGLTLPPFFNVPK